MRFSPALQRDSRLRGAVHVKTHLRAAHVDHRTVADRSRWRLQLRQLRELYPMPFPFHDAPVRKQESLTCVWSAKLLGISPNAPLPNQVVSTSGRDLPGENESGHRRCGALRAGERPESRIYGVPWFIGLYNSGAISRSAVWICAMLRPLASSNLP